MAITVGTIGIGVGPGGIRDSVRYLADCDWLTLTVENGRARIGLGVDARKLLEEATAPELRNVCACRPKDRLSLSEGVGLTWRPGCGGAPGDLSHASTPAGRGADPV